MRTCDDVDILLVEDNPQDAELTIRSLKKNNLSEKLHHVEDGEQALCFLFGTDAYSGRKPGSGPKLVLLDLKLPKVDGLEVLKKVRSDPRTRLIPIVALTSSNESRDIQECYKLGVNSYVVKPVEFDRFMEVVKSTGLYWLQVNRDPV